jgi:hypothetical protein
VINDKLLFLVKSNIKTNKLNFDNLFIIQIWKGSKYPHSILNKFYFDTTSFKFVNENHAYVDMTYVPFIETIINNIKTNINTITDEILINPLQIKGGPAIKKGLMNSIVTPVITPKIEKLEDRQEDKQALEKLISDLEKIKNEQLKNLETKETLCKNITTEYSQLANNLGDHKRELRKLKEREEELMNIFESDKGIYWKMKQQIKNGTLSEDSIPELFSKKYPILKFLDDEQLLDTDDDYFHYIEIYNDVYKDDEHIVETDKYVPHDIHYRNNNKYESLDKILAETYSDDDDGDIDDIDDIDDIEIENNTNENKSESLLDHPIFK